MFDRMLNPDTWAAVPFHFWSLAYFVLGCMWGSFLNVCIHRMPRDMSVISPPSHCPYCGYSIPWYLNVPLVTWLWLRGRCANCRAPISIRYFLVELLTGALFLACWLRFGSRGDPLPTLLLAAVYCVFVAGLIVATFIDFEHFIIPDEITIGGMVVGFLASIALPQLHLSASRGEAMLLSGLGIVVGGGVVFAVLNGGKLLFGKKKLELQPGSTITFHETELELPGELTPLAGVEGFDRAGASVKIPFARAMVGDEVLTGGAVTLSAAAVKVESAERNIDASDEIPFRLLEASGSAEARCDGENMFTKVARLLRKPGIVVLPDQRYVLSPRGIRAESEKIPFEEMFFRKSDTLRLHAASAEVCVRGSEPYPEVFQDVEMRLTPERLWVGEREFAPDQVPFLRVTTDSVVVPREAMGFGDVKFMAGIGAFLGWKATLFSLMISAVIGSVVGLTLVVLGRKDWSSKIPYGPYIALAALIWMFGGREFIRDWLALGGIR